MKTEITYQVGVEILKNVLQLSYESKLSYQQLIAQTNDDNVVEWLELKVDHLSGFISELLIELDALYINPELKSSIYSRFERFVSKLKYSFFEIEDVVIINKSLKLDNKLYNYIAKEIKDGMYSKKIYSLLKEEMSTLNLMIHPTGYSQLQAV